MKQGSNFYPKKHLHLVPTVLWTVQKKKLNLFEVWNKGREGNQLLANFFSPHSLSNDVILCVMRRSGKWPHFLVLLSNYSSWFILWRQNFLKIQNLGSWLWGWFNRNRWWICVVKGENIGGGSGTGSCLLWELFYLW